MEGFGELLRRHRLAAGLTQEALAEQSGVSVDAISALERGWRRSPRRETVAQLAEALRLAPADVSALVGAARRRGDTGASGQPEQRLPLPLTPLVGRLREVRAAATLLCGGEARLLTLTGAAGVGKTRLALAVCGDVAAHFPDGVFFANLAPLSEADLVPSALGESLGLSEVTARSLVVRIVEHVGDRRLLLLIDNFEHLLTSTPVLAHLLSRCAGLRILVTSRAGLNIRGEHELPVPSLPEPEAMELFVQRARAAAPGFELGASSVATVREICRRLEGLPLALELAAAWIRLLTPQALLMRLERRLPLLVGGARDLPERQRTMRAALEWSYVLVGASERTLLRRLSVFVGGADLEAIEAVALAVGPLEGEVLELLSTLVGFNLVHRDTVANEPRFGMLETVREYVRERLDESGEAAVAARAHASHYAALADTADRELTGPEQVGWLRRLDREHDNLRAALRWTRDECEVDLGLQLAASLWRFWETRGHSLEGLTWLESMLAIHSEASPQLRARAFNGAGNLARRVAAYARSQAHYEAALALHRSVGDRHGESSALNNLGNLAFLRGDLEAAIAVHEENIALRRRLGDERGVGVALNNLAIAVTQKGDPARAVALLQEGMAIRRARGDRQGMAYSLVNLGELARQLDDHERAAEWLEEAVELCRELGDMQLLAGALGNLGDVARARSDLATARARYWDSLRILAELGEERTVPYILEGMAALAWMEGRSEQAAYIYGAAAAIRERTEMPRLPATSASHDRIVGAVRDALGEGAFAAVEASGRHAPFDRVLSDLLADAPPGPTAGPTGWPP